MAKEKNDEKNLIVRRGKHAFIVINLYPYNSGHLMIVPYRHTDDLDALSDEESRDVVRQTVAAQKALQKTIRPQGFNFGANFGRVAGAGIEKHLHFHLVPRWNGDTNFFPVLADTKVISEDLKKTWRELRKAMR